MHEKILAGISRDLDELKTRNPKAYRNIESQLETISEKTDLEVHKSLRKKMRKVS